VVIVLAALALVGLFIQRLANVRALERV